MNKVSIITHTGCDISPDEARDISVRMVCDIVVLDNHTYRNLEELSPKQFYDLSVSASDISTSHFRTGEMIDAMNEASENSEELLCLSITSKMSGCYSASIVASEIFSEQNKDTKISVYDTSQCSHGMAIMVRKAAEMAEKGADTTEIISALDNLKDRIGIYFILDSLKYAKKGGRVGAVKMLTADILGIKPLMTFRNGEVKDIGVSRSTQEGINAVARRIREEADPSCEITVFHGDAPEKAEALASLIKADFPEASIRFEYVGPVIGVFAGPGTVGAAFTKK
ncbi:MAG: DegV family protein [Parasporobacterium sp.]|nr:DegV family protein [Parasporobacterium sp.]